MSSLTSMLSYPADRQSLVCQEPGNLGGDTKFVWMGKTMQILWDFGMFSVSLGVELKRSYNRDISSPIDCLWNIAIDIEIDSGGFGLSIASYLNSEVWNSFIGKSLWAIGQWSLRLMLILRNLTVNANLTPPSSIMIEWLSTWYFGR